MAATGLHRVAETGSESARVSYTGMKSRSPNDSLRKLKGGRQTHTRTANKKCGKRDDLAIPYCSTPSYKQHKFCASARESCWVWLMYFCTFYPRGKQNGLTEYHFQLCQSIEIEFVHRKGQPVFKNGDLLYGGTLGVFTVLCWPHAQNYKTCRCH